MTQLLLSDNRGVNLDQIICWEFDGTRQRPRLLLTALGGLTIEVKGQEAEKAHVYLIALRNGEQVRRLDTIAARLVRLEEQVRDSFAAAVAAKLSGATFSTLDGANIDQANAEDIANLDERLKVLEDHIEKNPPDPMSRRVTI